MKREAFEKAIHSDSLGEQPLSDQLDLEDVIVRRLLIERCMPAWPHYSTTAAAAAKHSLG